MPAVAGAEHGSGGDERVERLRGCGCVAATAIHSPNGVREDSPGERPAAVE